MLKWRVSFRQNSVILQQNRIQFPTQTIKDRSPVTCRFRRKVETICVAHAVFRGVLLTSGQFYLYWYRSKVRDKDIVQHLGNTDMLITSNTLAKQTRMWRVWIIERTISGDDQIPPPLCRFASSYILVITWERRWSGVETSMIFFTVVRGHT